jgi:hypothetical protein
MNNNDLPKQITPSTGITAAYLNRVAGASPQYISCGVGLDIVKSGQQMTIGVKSKKGVYRKQFKFKVFADKTTADAAAANNSQPCVCYVTALDRYYHLITYGGVKVWQAWSFIE